MVLIIIFRSFRKKQYSVVTAIIGALIIVLASTAMLIDALFIHVDGQSALVFLILPIYQWLACLILVLACLMTDKLFKPET